MSISSLSVRPTPVVIQPPAVEPVSLAEVKSHAIISGSDDDSLLTLMIKAARRAAEARMQAAIVARTLEIRLDAFPCGSICVETGPLRSVASVKYTDTAGLEQTVPGADYVVDPAALPGFVYPVYGKEWPETLYTPNAVRVRFIAGMAEDGTDVPEDVKLWLLTYVAAAYRNREAFVQGVTVAALPDRFVDALLDPWTRTTL